MGLEGENGRKKFSSLMGADLESLQFLNLNMFLDEVRDFLRLMTDYILILPILALIYILLKREKNLI